MMFDHVRDVHRKPARLGHGAIRAAAIVSLLFAAVSLPSRPARAIDPALCKDDGVTEVPPWAQGRDSSQCLMVNPGNGDPVVKFQYETFHKKGISRHAERPVNAGVDWIDANAYQWGNCSTKDSGQLCNFVMWDTVIDNYLDPGAQNEDGFKIHYWGTQNYLIKNSKIMNTVHCKGGGWTGPNGVKCIAGNVSGAHVDGIQMREVPNAGGWIVIQDSVLANVGNAASLIQLQPRSGAAEGLLFQGLQFGQFNTPLGASTTWINDCIQMGKDPAICSGVQNGFQIGTEVNQIWFVNVWGNMRFIQLGATPSKIVVVNRGCGPLGCGGAIGYFDGWPHPLQTFSGGSDGPSTCPNGKYATSPKAGVAVYCYTSVENALKEHKAPPFIHLSASGWAAAPSGTAPPPSPSPTRPAPPILEP